MNKQTILITGATAGIGRQTALHLLRRGHHVIATGRGLEALVELEHEAFSAPTGGGQLSTIRLDVTDGDSIKHALNEVGRLTAGRGIDVLVNNAGFGMAVPTSEISDADLRAQYETNVFGLMAMVHAFLPQMRARGKGRIINVSSVGGRITFPFYGTYNSTKYAVESLSDALRCELKPFGIEVVIVEPGMIRTKFLERSNGAISSYQRPESPYSQAYNVYQRLAARMDRFAPGPQVVARAIERGATARRPRARYIVPFVGGRLQLALVRVLPTRFLDWVFARVLGLTSKKLLAASTEQRALV
jgi:NAD(P)-dependent dehydrogenase (short-subunit alcohol dehydrogenase family)